MGKELREILNNLVVGKIRTVEDAALAIENAGYKSLEQIALMFNPDYLDFKKGVESTRKLFKDYVRLADDQSLPIVDPGSTGGYSLVSFGEECQQDMLKAGWRKVELEVER